MDRGTGRVHGNGDTDEDAAAARHARFGRLPEPVRVEDTVEERPAAAPDPARHAYDPDEWLVRYCL
ncbi:hypothetical protein [Streptomyces sp. Tu 3180]|uniref:hypothetical protein n=1 Tax=Streptomyces sp. Tu 3180 TaxID=2682611 RepID=UPI001356C62E|nr:hypothetical protein [Streptomyces sp. Tu 3180]KAF3463683.1 hypothetical protein GL259_04785 [Streptomyces sp. Tu 3180]